MPSPLSKVDLDLCVTTADQCCQYYANVLATYESCSASSRWHEMRRLADLWRSLLSVEDPTKTKFVDLETRVIAKWAASHCGVTWVCLATSIDIWLRWRGRAGLGKNPWYKDRAPATVRPL
jgi:hypothetical protein